MELCELNSARAWGLPGTDASVRSNPGRRGRQTRGCTTRHEPCRHWFEAGLTGVLWGKDDPKRRVFGGFGSVWYSWADGAGNSWCGHLGFGAKTSESRSAKSTVLRLRHRRNLLSPCHRRTRCFQGITHQQAYTLDSTSPLDTKTGDACDFFSSVTAQTASGSAVRPAS